MRRPSASWLRYLFDPAFGRRDRLAPRWLLLRALALIYLSAFYSLLRQANGLIGPSGILPSGKFLDAVHKAAGPMTRFWYAPTLYWISASGGFITALCWIGLIASVVAFFNLWPRLSFFICFLCFLSFVTAAGVFSEYQSDGMLLQFGFVALFFAPAGFRPGLGASSPPSRVSYFLLQWEWFTIYFESGLAKLLSGDPEWRRLTAMDHYYQNCPLPTWIGWYVQHFPHWFQTATAGATLIMELGLVFLMFLPRKARLICFLIVTPWEIAVILTANYAFLNYLVLALGILLLDDRWLSYVLPKRFFAKAATQLKPEAGPGPELKPEPESETEPEDSNTPISILNPAKPALPRAPKLSQFQAFRFALCVVVLTLVFYSTAAQLVLEPFPWMPLPTQPIQLLSPFRIANRYGLFAVMTRGRYEIEFQGSNDGTTWTAYPYRYKPQALNQPPGIYAPYQPRFDWNLWFASLDGWRRNPMVPITEERLLENDPTVPHLFAGNPFGAQPPKYVRAVLWQYWMTSMQQKRQTGNWWKRKLLGAYAPTLTITPQGFAVVHWPEPLPPHD